MTSDIVAWVLHRAGFYLPSSDSQTARLRVWSEDSSPISLGKAEMHDDDVRCSMGATESGFLLTCDGSPFKVEVLQSL